LRVFVDGREFLPQETEAVEAPSIQIPFDPPWSSKQARDLAIEYALEPPAPGNALIALSENSAHLRDYGWFPELLPPGGLFAKGGHRPRKARLTVRVPDRFRVLASGRGRGVTRQAGEALYRTAQGEAEYVFEWRREDPEPFLVAGRYSETRAETPEGTVVFWTFAPMESSAAKAAAAAIAGSFRSYEKFFGPLPGRQGPLWIVETPARLASHTRTTAGGESPAGIGFPAGALLNERALALGVSSDAFLDLVEHELAHAWFGQALAARPEAEVLLTEALSEYAVLVADEARGGDAARRRRAALLLRWYHQAHENAADKPLIALEPNDPWEQRVFGYSKGALFFVALEDECGKDALRRGLARMVRALHGERAGLHELRAAIEDEGGRNLADFFRAWLNHPGIPPDFRTRYELHP
jgi:hypothetical protein